MLKIILLLSLFVTAPFCHAQQQVQFKGNTITLSPADTISVIDPVTGVAQTVVNPPHPAYINGKRIYIADTLTVYPAFKSAADEKLSAWLFDHLKKELSMLDDGNYILSVNDVVIDNKGKLAYYKYGGIKKVITKTVMIIPADKPAPDSLPTALMINGHVIRLTSDSLSDRSETGHDTRTVTSPYTPPPGIIGSDAPSNTGESKSYSREEATVTEEGIDALAKEKINAAAERLLAILPVMKPGQIKHIPVACTGSVFSTWSYIIVRDHKPVFTPFYDGL